MVARKIVVVGILSLALLVVGVIVASNTAVGTDTKKALTEIASTATSDQNATDSRTLAAGQDEDAKTQVNGIQMQEKIDSTEKFIVDTFVLEPQTSKRIVFKTAAADRVKLEGEVSVVGPGTVSVSVDNKYCGNCGPYTKFGTYHPRYPGPYYDTIPSMSLLSDKEQTLIIRNNAGVSQTVSLDLQI
jgi:hypothetical protein